MLHNVKCTVICNTLAKRDNIFTIITNFLATRPNWQERVSVTKIIDAETKKYSLEIYGDLEDVTNKQQVFQEIKTRLQSVIGIRVVLSRHVCSHDARSPGPCTNDELWDMTL